MSLKTLVRGRIFNPLTPTSGDYYHDGALVINSLGRVEAIGEFSALQRSDGFATILDYRESLILPGLIDVHTHLPQLPIRGKVAGTLLEWLTKYAFPVEEAFAQAAYAEQLSWKFFQSLKANGTTTALVLSSVHEASTDLAFQAAEKSGMRIAMGKVMMDQEAPAALLESLAGSVAASTRLAQKWHNTHEGLLRYAFTPRFVISCSQAMLEAAGELHRQFPDSYLHSHLAEHPGEVTRVEARYQNTLSYTQVYEKAGCLGPSTIMAHGIYLSKDEMAIIERTQTRLAHCPTSNFFLKSGVINLQALQDRNITFGLGSDVGAGPDICMFRVMRAMDEIQLTRQKFVPPYQALYAATLGGAKTLNWEDETGNLLPGKSADFIVVDTHSLDTWRHESEPIEVLLSQLMYLGTGLLVQKTFVRGKMIYAKPENPSKASKNKSKEYASKQDHLPLTPPPQTQSPKTPASR